MNISLVASFNKIYTKFRLVDYRVVCNFRNLGDLFFLNATCIKNIIRAKKISEERIY